MDLEKLIIFQRHKGIFTLFCALGFTKTNYFGEISDKKISNISKEVSSFLSKKKIPSVSRLKKFFKKQHPYYFVNWVLQHSDPPQFKRLYRKWGGELSLKWYKGFGKFLRRFYFEADIAQLWERYQETYSKEIGRYRKKSFSIIQKALIYLRIKKTPFKKIVFIPNLLDKIGAGYGPTVHKKAYIIFGPSKTNINTQLICHEFLHSIINPLVQRCDRNNKLIQRNKRFLQKAASSFSLKYYDEAEAITSEYIIRAIEGRLVSFNKRSNYIKEQIKLGFPFARFFEEQLKEYESNSKIFSEYLPVILENIKFLRKNI